MYQFEWSEAAVLRLEELLRLGYSASQIGKDLGTGRNSVIGKVHRSKFLMAIGLGGKGNKAQKSIKAQVTVKKAKLVVARAPAIKKAKHTFHAGNLKAKKAGNGSPVIPLPSVVEDLFNADALRLTLMELAPRTCRWDVASPALGEEYRFCGKHTDEGQSWCPHHRAKVYLPHSQRRAA